MYLSTGFGGGLQPLTPLLLQSVMHKVAVMQNLWGSKRKSCRLIFVFLFFLSFFSYLSGRLQREERKLLQTRRVFVSVRNYEVLKRVLSRKQHMMGTVWVKSMWKSLWRVYLKSTFISSLINISDSPTSDVADQLIVTMKRGGLNQQNIRFFSPLHHSLTSLLPMSPSCH